MVTPSCVGCTERDQWMEAQQKRQEESESSSEQKAQGSY